MRLEKFNEGWKFWADRDSFSLVWNVPENAKSVTLPHDAMILNPSKEDSLNGGSTGFRDGDTYTYVKKIYIPAEEKGKVFMLKFEGVYMNAFVYVNEQLAAKNPFGYTDFYVELNDFIKYGQENEIRVQVRAGAMTNSRWYSGAGIYRDVYLLESGMTYIVPQGLMISTEEADNEFAVMNITATVKNRENYKRELIAVTEIFDKYDKTVGLEKTSVTAFSQEKRKISQRIAIENPMLWSDENPELYKCVTTIYEKGNMNKANALDRAEEKFGIRTVSADAKRGLRINGQTVKLRGACVHHDSGLLGAATYETAQYRQVKKLKEAGFNAIRMSHQPMAPAMLRACDELGMYVMDETFDMWTRCKSNYDYGLFFNEWWESDVAAMVKKDYNHPSVIIYSIGNEIPEIGTDKGSQIAYEINEKIKSMDNTRLTTAAINGVFAAADSIGRIVADVSDSLKKEGKIEGNVNDFMTLMDGHLDDIVVHDAVSEKLDKACAATDIAGYNYMTGRYESDGVKYPNRVIVGSETYPPEIARNVKLMKELPYVIGDFTWTGWDYIGEAGVGIPAYNWGEGGFGAKFPAQLAYVGDIDITGFRRPASYFREIVFGFRKAPYIAVQNPYKYGEHLIKTPWVISDASSSWTYDDCNNKPVIVEVYAGGTEVELFKNGISLGRKQSGELAGYRVLFETVYEPGTLTAVVYDDGNEIGRMELKTAESDRKLKIEREAGCGIEEGFNLVYLPITIADKNGVTASDNDEDIRVEVSGEAEILGFGSGNPKPIYNYIDHTTRTFEGRAMLIVKIKKGNSAAVTISSDKYGRDTIELTEEI